MAKQTKKKIAKKDEKFKVNLKPDEALKKLLLSESVRINLSLGDTSPKDAKVKGNKKH